MRHELQSIGVWSVIKVSFFFNLVAGLLFGLLSAPFIGAFLSGLMASSLFSEFDSDPSELSMGFLFVVVPLISAGLWAVFNTIIMGVLAIVYNLVATMIGGIEFDYRDVETADVEDDQAISAIPPTTVPPVEFPSVAETAEKAQTPPPPPPVSGSIAQASTTPPPAAPLPTVEPTPEPATVEIKPEPEPAPEETPGSSRNDQL